MAYSPVRTTDRKLLADAVRLCRRLHAPAGTAVLLFGTAALFSPDGGRGAPDKDPQGLLVFCGFLVAGFLATAVTEFRARRVRRTIQGMLVTYLQRQGPARRTVFARATSERMTQASLLGTLDALVDEGRVRHTDHGYAAAES